MSRRIVKLFQGQFVPKIQDGTKTSTIRPTPRRPQDMPKPGDILDAREWNGLPYRSKQRKIGEFEIVEVDIVMLHAPRRITDTPIEVWKGAQCLRRSQTETLAQGDGFPNALNMREWFRVNHGIDKKAFKGVFIKWRVNRCHSCKKVINAGATDCPHCLAIDAEA